jgi:hypothetical protein
MDPADSVLAVVLVGAASFIAGLFGFGFGIVATAGLSLSMALVDAANLVNLASPFVTASLFWQLRHAVQRRVVLRITPWLLAGVALGVFALTALDGAVMVRALGVLVVAAAAWNLSGRALRVPESVLADALAGVASGVFGGAFNSGGPPLIAYVYSRPGSLAALKGTLQALFLVSSFARMGFAALQGLFDGSMWSSAALAIPFAVAGQYAGHALSERIESASFRRLAWLGLGALGVVLLVRG